MSTALVRQRSFIDRYSCVDRWREVQYKTKQLIGSLWYLYSQGGYVICTFAKEDIKFID